MNTYSKEIEFIRELYPNQKTIYLHEPLFIGNEKKYLIDAIDSTFVSSVGPYVDKFEEMMRDYTGASHAIAVVNGTAALHISLILAGVESKDLVITQALSFIATCNAISYIGAEPCFIDVDLDNLGMSADALEQFLEQVELKNGLPFHKPTGKKIGACVPMHTFGFPVDLDKIVDLCNKYNIPLVEDAAESLGSTYKNRQTGTFGLLGTFSFNGNKTITSGGGGIIVTNDEKLGKMAKHLTTQAKIPHRWKFEHDHIAYNYRCPNLNSALACAQLEQLDTYIENKRETALKYADFFKDSEIKYISEPVHSKSNYWLNAILLKDEAERDSFLEKTNDIGVITRPIWTLMNKLEMFKNCLNDGLKNSHFIEERLVNLPSSVRLR